MKHGLYWDLRTADLKAWFMAIGVGVMVCAMGFVEPASIGENEVPFPDYESFHTSTTPTTREKFNFPKECGVFRGVLEYGQTSSECRVERKRDDDSQKRRATRAAWSWTGICGTERELVAFWYRNNKIVVLRCPDN